MPKTLHIKVAARGGPVRAIPKVPLRRNVLAVEVAVGVEQVVVDDVGLHLVF